MFEGVPLLLVHTVGARTGKLRVKPVMYFKDGERHVVFSSKGGHPKNSDWYHDLRARPDLKIEAGDETLNVHADEAEGQERDAVYERQSNPYPEFAEYQRKTKRVIPVFVLARRQLQGQPIGLDKMVDNGRTPRDSKGLQSRPSRFKAIACLIPINHVHCRR